MSAEEPSEPDPPRDVTQDYLRRLEITRPADDHVPCLAVGSWARETSLLPLPLAHGDLVSTGGPPVALGPRATLVLYRTLNPDLEAGGAVFYAAFTPPASITPPLRMSHIEALARCLAVCMKLLWMRTRTTAPVHVPSYEQFFRESFPKLTQRLRILCSYDESMADDIAQEAFLLAYHRWDHLSATEHPYAWVKKVAVRLAWRWLKERSKRQPADLATELLEIASENNADIPMLVDLKRALAQLPPRQREVATLRMLLDFEPTEIADVLGLAPGTVRAHLHAARKTLSTRLEGPQS